MNTLCPQGTYHHLGEGPYKQQDAVVSGSTDEGPLVHFGDLGKGSWRS